MWDFVTAKTAYVSPETVAVKPDLVLPEMLGGTEIKYRDREDLKFSADAKWDPVSGSYGLTRLELITTGTARLTTVFLHALSAPVFLDIVMRVAMTSETTARTGRKPQQYYLDLKTGRLTDELLLEVARRAATAQALQGTPNREVMECFDVPQRTASHWISRARQRGFLD